MVKMEILKDLMFQTGIGSGEYEGRKFSISQNLTGQYVLIKFEGCPSVRVNVTDLVPEAYEKLKAEGELKVSEPG